MYLSSEFFHRYSLSFPLKLQFGKLTVAKIALTSTAGLYEGRTIRKVMAGEGNFQVAGIFFFCSLLVHEFFFQVKPSARIFFFKQIVLFSQ